jgi:hypothetical protein
MRTPRFDSTDSPLQTSQISVENVGVSRVGAGRVRVLPESVEAAYHIIRTKPQVLEGAEPASIR